MEAGTKSGPLNRRSRNWSGCWDRRRWSWHYRHNGYGRPRTTAELRERLDYRINSKRVERLLRDPLLIKKAIDITLRKGWAEIRPSHLIFSIVCMRCIAKINDTRSRLQGSAEGTTGITLLPVTCSHKWYLPTIDGRQNPSPLKKHKETVWHCDRVDPYFQGRNGN